ncbi:polyhydroxyalkanoate synthesis regulator DNA-binding domain-containing protein [Streptomyces sp. NPDC060333]|uniref:polyhydroxyalkanoate synthesis regulator DNA-binding domain-containing protein n=2 Tax=unclassified Streptomyces TaxID=2593676 RepID=UPI003663D29A
MDRVGRATGDDRPPGRDLATHARAASRTGRGPVPGGTWMTTRADAGTDGELLLVRTRDGRLFDTRTRRPVTLEGLAGEVRCGRRFRVREGASGGECTYQVLARVLLTGLVSAVPGAARAVRGSSGMVEPMPDAMGDGSPPGRKVRAGDRGRAPRAPPGR